MLKLSFEDSIDSKEKFESFHLQRSIIHYQKREEIGRDKKPGFNYLHSLYF